MSSAILPDTLPAALNEEVPPGFQPFQHLHIGFIELIGPLYFKREGAVETLGWRVLPKHCNAYPMAHGGMTAAFADILTSHAVYTSQTPRGEVLTISLTTDFLNVAPLGAWVEGRARLVSVGTSIGFATCEIFADDKLIMQASGKFKIRPKRPLSV